MGIAHSHWEEEGCLQGQELERDYRAAAMFQQLQEAVMAAGT